MARRDGITRRDFLQGAALGGTGLLLSGRLGLRAQGSPSPITTPADYPPTLTGMRGSNDGSFEVAHGLRDGSFWKTCGEPVATGESYDLVIVGGGPSGLASAYWYQQLHGGKARILVLENHDDVGGHARRNEFYLDGKLLLGFGGSYAIESPNPYGPISSRLLSELGIDPDRGEQTMDRDFYASRGMGRAIFFDRETYGTDALVPDPFGDPGGESNDRLLTAWDPWPGFMAKAPLPPEAREELQRLCLEPRDPWPDLEREEKHEKLSRISYGTFLTDVMRVHPAIRKLLQCRTHSLYGLGIDAVSAIECYHGCLPGFDAMDLDDPRPADAPPCDAFEGGSKFYHFPDGNASLVRLMLRSMIPGILPDGPPERIVPAPLDYAKLDDAANKLRVRRRSTVVRVRHEGDPATATAVEVSYFRDGKLQTVRGAHCIMACWSSVVPFLCPELPAPQREALNYSVKIPLVYASVVVNRWKPFHDLGCFTIYAPGGYFTSVDVGRPVRMDSYHACDEPEDPCVVHMVRTPCSPGLPNKQQHKVGRTELLSTSFDTFEREIRDQLGRILSPGGFDPSKDIRAITINRWPHGYSYEYSPLWDAAALALEEPPHVTARKRFGRIAIANADSGAYSYLDSAIDQAHRAVTELTS